ncbi:MAG: DUF6090 family protein [Flavobacteriaceae bacterium]
MIKYFRKIRQRLLTENKFSKYLLYAIGEILLVVIGILIALQINNQNDIRKARIKEIHYLKNIKTDLKINIFELDNYIKTRKESIESANTIIEHIEGEPIKDIEEFNALGVPIYNWQKFHQNNNTFQELVGSGNLALISNDSIKNMLLNIETLYKKLKSEEEHYRFDTEELIYRPLYEMMDLNPMVNNFQYKLSNGTLGRNTTLTADYYKKFLASTKIKNGFVMTILEFSTMNAQMLEMKNMSLKLINLIDKEITKG